MLKRHMLKNHLATVVTLTLATFLMPFAVQVGGQSALARTTDDAEIARAVTAELSEETGVRADDIQIACVEGIVTLEGVVDTLADKRQAVAVATTIRGVRAVVDQMSLRPSDPDVGQRPRGLVRREDAGRTNGGGYPRCPGDCQRFGR